VDAAAFEMLRSPQHFDVILTDNLFGDILSDEAAAVAGSIGVLPSASLGPGAGLYEPVHGAAPDIAGRGIANPIAAIWAGALMLDHLGETEAHDRIVAAITRVLAESGPRTPDLGGHATTEEVTTAILDAL
jgi:isocitrate/isopropylmalate dehydrogenase